MATTEERIREIESLQEKLQSQLNELKNELKPNFEVGKWYKGSGKNLWYIVRVNNTCSQESYGFSGTGEWCDLKFRQSCIKECKPATDKEVEEALIKEAERQKLIKGVSVKSLATGFKSVLTGGYQYIPELNQLWAKAENLHNILLFNKGKWAEIIKDEPIKIGGYEVKFNDNYIIVNGCDYTKNDLECAKRVLSMPKIGHLMVGCNSQYKLDLETINKILEKL